MTTGFVQRYKGKIKAHVVQLGAGGIVDSTTGAQLMGGAALDGLTAHAEGGQSSATQLQYGMNRVSSVASANDSVALPTAVANAWVLLVNDGGNAAKVFARNGSSDTIDGVTGSTGVTIANAKRDLFYCLTAGAWISLLGAKSA
jgi:hypothetical protein